MSSDELYESERSAARELLVDWIDRYAYWISDTSGDKYGGLIDKARNYASRIGIEWSDDLIPDYIAEVVAMEKEWEESRIARIAQEKD